MNVKELIKMEFKRVFHSKMFYLSLGIGLLITTLQWIEVGLPMAVNIVDGYIPSEVSTPYSAFESFRTGRCRWSIGRFIIRLPRF